MTMEEDTETRAQGRKKSRWSRACLKNLIVDTAKTKVVNNHPIGSYMFAGRFYTKFSGIFTPDSGNFPLHRVKTPLNLRGFPEKQRFLVHNRLHSMHSAPTPLLAGRHFKSGEQAA